MCKHYATPVLLIEFDPEKAFAMQSVADIGSDIRGGNVASKLVLLLLNFPKLRCATLPVRAMRHALRGCFTSCSYMQAF